MASGELVSLILKDDVEGIKTLLAEKGDIIDLEAEDVEYQEDGIEKTLNKPIIVVAIECGNLNVVKLLLEKGVNVNKFYKGMHPPGPIFFITEYSNPKVSEEIAMAVFEHSNLNLKNSKGQTILYEAQIRSADYAAEIIKKFGVNIAERDITGHTVVDEVLYHDMYLLMPIYQQYVLNLILHNDVNTIQNLVLDGFEYVLQGGGVSALDIARSHEAEDVAEFIEKIPQLMDTIPTLHSAVGAGNLEGLQTIITSQLASAKDSGGRCTLHLAIMLEQEEVAKYLIENFPDTIKITDVYQRTPLHYAAALPNGDSYYETLVKAGANEMAADCNNLTPKDYRTEFANPGSRTTEVDVQHMIENEKGAKYGVKIYLKLQYQAILKTIEENDTKVAQDLIDNLAFGIDDFVTEGISNIPLLFLCVQKGAEDIALYLLIKGANPMVRYEDTSLQDAAFKAKMSGLYHTLAEALGFKERRLSAFSETSSMLSDKIIMPNRPPPLEQKAPAGLNGFDSQYLGRVLGPALIDGLAAVTERRPWDPIEYLAQWLYKYSLNQMEKQKKIDEEYHLELEKAQSEKDKIHSRRQKKEAKHLQKLDQERQKQLDEDNRLKAEEEQKRRELEELRNKQRETDQLAQPPELDTVKEDVEPATEAPAESSSQEADTEQASSEQSAEQQSTEPQQEETTSGGGDGGGEEPPAAQEEE